MNFAPKQKNVDRLLRMKRTHITSRVSVPDVDIREAQLLAEIQAAGIEMDGDALVRLVSLDADQKTVFLYDKGKVTYPDGEFYVTEVTIFSP